jgi:hypothetical protein
MAYIRGGNREVFALYSQAAFWLTRATKSILGASKLETKMAYAVEAVQWTADRTVDAVRWHEFEYVGGALQKGPSVVVTIRGVVKAAASGHDLYLCYRGAVGRKIDVVALPDGRMTLVDLLIGDRAQSLADLPSI